MAELPAGTVTFLFTDVEGSPRLLHKLGNGTENCMQKGCNSTSTAQLNSR